MGKVYSYSSYGCGFNGLGDLLRDPVYTAQQETDYAKKFDCPCCGKRRNAQVLNINEINRDMREKTLKAGLHWLLLMFIGGMLILVLAGIPISFLDRAARRQAEDMRQQRYEELKERYFGEDTD